MTPPINTSSYSVIPSYIMDDPDIEDGAKLLFARISMYSNEGRCWAGNAHFAEKHKVTVRCIQKWLEQLKDKGYIEVEIEKGGFQTQRNIWITNDFKKSYTKRNTVHPSMNPSSCTPEPQFIHINTSKQSVCTVCTDEPSSNQSNIVEVVHNSEDKATHEDATYKPNFETVKITHPDGSQSTIRKDMVYSHCSAKKIDWRAEEIETAWVELLKSKNPIREPYEYIAGIIQNLRIKAQNKAITNKPKREQSWKQPSTQKEIVNEQTLSGGMCRMPKERTSEKNTSAQILQELVASQRPKFLQSQNT